MPDCLKRNAQPRAGRDGGQRRHHVAEAARRETHLDNVPSPVENTEAESSRFFPQVGRPPVGPLPKRYPFDAGKERATDTKAGCPCASTEPTPRNWSLTDLTASHQPCGSRSLIKFSSHQHREFRPRRCELFGGVGQSTI